MVLAVEEILVKGGLLKVTHIKHLEDWAHADTKINQAMQLSVIFTFISGQAYTVPQETVPSADKRSNSRKKEYKTARLLMIFLINLVSTSKESSESPDCLCTFLLVLSNNLKLRRNPNQKMRKRCSLSILASYISVLNPTAQSTASPFHRLELNILLRVTFYIQHAYLQNVDLCCTSFRSCWNLY